jgi:hypothetical protein
VFQTIKHEEIVPAVMTEGGKSQIL